MHENVIKIMQMILGNLVINIPLKSCMIHACVVDYPKHIFGLFNDILNVTKYNNYFSILQFSTIYKFVDI